MQRNIQENVRDMRHQLGLTQQSLAVEMGKATITIAKWETSRCPSGQSLIDLINFARKKTTRPCRTF